MDIASAAMKSSQYNELQKNGKQISLHAQQNVQGKLFMFIDELGAELSFYITLNGVTSENGRQSHIRDET